MLRRCCANWKKKTQSRRQLVPRVLSWYARPYEYPLKPPFMELMLMLHTPGLRSRQDIHGVRAPCRTMFN